MSTKEAQKLAPATVEALGKLDVECPECKGSGFVKTGKLYSPIPPLDAKSCPKCRLAPKYAVATGKIKWKWEPKVGEAFVEYGHKKPHFIRSIFIKKGYDIKIWDYYGREFGVNRHKLIPILHWETIEKIIEGSGYSMQFEECPSGFICEVFREIDSSSATAVKARKVFLCRGAGKYRQTAAMEAIIQFSEG